MLYAGLCLQGRGRELAAAGNLGFRDYLIMQEGIPDAVEILDQDPLARFILRLCGRDRMGLAGEVAARADLEWLLLHTRPKLRAAIDALIPINEPNLDDEHLRPHSSGSWHTVAAYQKIDRWLCAYVREIHRLLAGVSWDPLILGPALSPAVRPPGHSVGESYALLVESSRALDGLAVHLYGPLADLDHGSGRLGLHTQAFEDLGLDDKPVFVTEVNQVNFADFCRYAAGFPQVRGVFWFGWRMNPEHSQYNLVPPYSDGFEDYLAGQGPSPPDPQPPSEVEIVDGYPIAWGFLKEYRRRGRHDGAPLGPEAHCGPCAIQAFASGAVYVWDGGHVHVLCDRV